MIAGQIVYLKKRNIANLIDQMSLALTLLLNNQFMKLAENL